MEIIIIIIAHSHIYISARSMRSVAFCSCAHLSKAHKGSEHGDLKQVYGWNTIKMICPLQHTKLFILLYLDDGVKSFVACHLEKMLFYDLHIIIFCCMIDWVKVPNNNNRIPAPKLN